MKISNDNRAFLKHQRGAAAIEFAIVLPVILLLFAAVIEISRYIQAREKLESATANILDMINQNENVDASGLAALVNTTPELMEPFPVEAGTYSAIVTSVVKGGQFACKPYALWQFSTGGQSRVATGEGALTSLPALSLMPNEQAVTLEMYYRYTPLLSFDVPLLGGGVYKASIMPTTMYRLMVAKPRYGSFTKHPISGRLVEATCQ